MKLLARILSHGFAIAVVLLLAIGLIYRGELFPEYGLPDFLDIGKLADHKKESGPGHVDRDVAAGQHEAPAAAGDQDQTAMQGGVTVRTGEPGADSGAAEGFPATEVMEPGPAEADLNLQEPAGVDSSQPSPTVDTDTPPVMSEEMAESPQEEGSASDLIVPLPEETGQQPGEESPEVSAPQADESTAATAADLTEPGSMPEGVAESAEAAAASAESDTAVPEETVAAEPVSGTQEKAYQLLADAREAFWLRDYEAAESKYQSLTRLEPDNPDGYGELGNMYFSQGKWDQAATAYYEAGVRLIGQGLLTQAEELIAVIRGLNGANADALEQKVADARSAANQ